VRDALTDLLGARGFPLESVVSQICTDPWNYRAQAAPFDPPTVQ
jgi:hypothetical protein